MSGFDNRPDFGDEPETKGKVPRRMDLDSIGRILLLLGVGVIGVGILFVVAARIPGVNQLFNLPGDIRIESGNVSCFFPIVSMIILSLLLTVVANIIIRFLNR
jgi:hypothetical protein